MVRTVRVQLDADAAEYISSTEKATVSTVGLKEQVDGLDDKLKKIPADSAKAAAAMRLLGGDADGVRGKLHDLGPEATNSLQLIDKQLEETRAKLRQAAEDFNQTGSADSFSLWKKLTADHGELEKLKKDLSAALGVIEHDSGDSGDRSGKSFTSRFVGVFAQGSAKMVSGLANLPWVGAIFKPIESAFETMPPEAKIAIGSAIAAAIAGSGVLIGAALDGALLSGVGLGGIALGIVGQFNSPLVHSALAGLGQNLLAVLHSSTAAFVNPLFNAAGILNTAFAKIEPELTATMKKLSVAVDPLAQGLGKLVINLMPGLDRALAAATPILLIVAKQLPALGSALSDMFERMSKGSRGAGEALQYVLIALEAVIRWTGSFIGLLGEMFQGFVAFADDISGVVVKMLGWIPVVGDHLKKNAEMLHDLRSGQDAAGLSSDNLKVSMDGLTGSLSGTTAALQQLDQAALEWHREAMTAKQDSLSFQDSVDSLTQALKGSKKGLTDNTQAGRQAEEAYLAGAQAAQEHAAAVYESTGSAVAAAKAYQQDKAQLDAAAKAAGASKAQIDALNKSLDNTVKVRKGSVTITVNLTGNGAALIGNQGSYIQIGNRNKLNRWGGIYQHAEEGALRQADIYSPMEPARYAFAEPATGGEAFVPRYGDYMRSTAILDQAARWYGGRFVSGMATPSAATPAVTVAAPQVRVYIGNEEITSRVQVVVDQANQRTAAAVAGGVRY